MAVVVDLESNGGDSAGVMTARQLLSCVCHLQDQSTVPLLQLLDQTEEEFWIAKGALTSNIRSAEESSCFFPSAFHKRQKFGTKYGDTILIDAWKFTLFSSGIMLELFSLPCCTP